MRRTELSRNRRSWLTTRTAPGNDSRYVSSQRRPPRSRWFVGSSSRRIVGRARRTPASITRACSPPESSRNLAPEGRWAIARWLRASSIAAWKVHPSRAAKRSWTAPYSRSVRELPPGWAIPASSARMRASSSYTSPIDRRRKSCSVRSASGACWWRNPMRSSGPVVTVPASADSSPARMRRSVDLPVPFGPTRPVRSPLPRVNVASVKSGSASCALHSESAFTTGAHTSHHRV